MLRVLGRTLARCAPLWLLATLAGAPAPLRAEGVQAADLYKIQLPRQPLISPDGKRVAYLVESADAQTDAVLRRLHVIDAATLEDRVIEVAGDLQSVLWASNTSLLALAAGHDPAQPVSLLRVSVPASGAPEAVSLASLPTVPSSVALSHDGRRLAYFMNVPEPRRAVSLPAPPPGANAAPPARYTERTVWRTDGIGEVEGDDQLFVMDLSSAQVTQLTEGSMPGGIYPSGLGWSRDDRKIVFSSNLRSGWEQAQFNSDLYALEVASKRIEPLTRRIGPDFDPKFSPDGRWIAYRGFDDAKKPFSGVISLYLMRADGSGIRQLADVGQAIGTHEWDAQSGGLYISFVREGVQRLAHVDLAGRLQDVASDIAPDGGLYVEPYLSGAADIGAGTAGVVAVVATPGDPGELVLFETVGKNVDGKAWRRRVLARPNAAWLGQAPMARTTTRELRYTAPDGTPLQAWLLLPPGVEAADKTCPLVLDIHGGPDLAYGPQFSFRFQRYAAEGYAVLLPNYRGSAGADMRHYGVPWQFPDAEYGDLMAAVDAAIQAAPIDPRRLFVTGLSAGGILTAWTVGKTDRFAAAAVQSPIINWISHSLTQDLYSAYVERSFEKMPWEDPMAYWRRSPLSLVGHVSTPSLVIQGEKDSRTPASEGIQFYQALKLRGVPSALLLMPESFHIPTRPSQWIEEQQYILDWFARHPVRAAPAKPTSP